MAGRDSTVLRRTGAALAAIALLALGACATESDEGTAGEQTTRAEPLNAAEAFGQFRALDPCSLLGGNVFAAHGETQELPRPSFDECALAVLVEDTNIEVAFGLLQRADSLSGEQTEVGDLGRGSKVLRTETSDTSCLNHVVFADNITVDVETTAPSGKIAKDQLCGVADTAATGIFHATQADQAQSWDLPPGSLASLSACSMLSGKQVTDQLDVSAEPSQVYPAERRCRWGEPGGDNPTATVEFSVGAAQQGTNREIAGLPSTVVETKASTVGTCAVYAERGQFTLGEEDTSELAIVRTALPGAGQNPCKVAIALAEQVWPQLPEA
ncbi:hypothetical protein EV191_1011148 [Tamaricihabitans halophyticus]|uniref:DUF3558 domain-containing protein n=1 Tax=Tamaricihabitans halophyticus TaxID=1262583 RepID=A0A4R2RCP3_9PSEU|nr:hypothetical protein [Tamaricihabitans halophyticus]TCP57195.1 hypothetical protein EV191_1011148 [Tamaricihabitans halophyticus]